MFPGRGTAMDGGARRLAALGLIALAITVIALAITAAPANAAATRAEYISQVDPICQGAVTGSKRAARGVVKDLQKRRDRRAARKIAKANRLFRGAIEQIAPIPPPSSDAKLIADWIALLRSEVPLVKRVVGLLRRHASDKKLTSAIVKLFARSNQARTLVARYGFAWCQQL